MLFLLLLKYLLVFYKQKSSLWNSNFKAEYSKDVGLLEYRAAFV